MNDRRQCAALSDGRRNTEVNNANRRGISLFDGIASLRNAALQVSGEQLYSTGGTLRTAIKVNVFFIGIDLPTVNKRRKQKRQAGYTSSRHVRSVMATTRCQMPLEQWYKTCCEGHASRPVDRPLTATYTASRRQASLLIHYRWLVLTMHGARRHITARFVTTNICALHSPCS